MSANASRRAVRLPSAALAAISIPHIRQLTPLSYQGMQFGHGVLATGVRLAEGWGPGQAASRAAGQVAQHRSDRFLARDRRQFGGAGRTWGKKPDPIRLIGARWAASTTSSSTPPAVKRSESQTTSKRMLHHLDITHRRSYLLHLSQLQTMHYSCGESE